MSRCIYGVIRHTIAPNVLTHSPLALLGIICSPVQWAAGMGILGQFLDQSLGIPLQY